MNTQRRYSAAKALQLLDLDSTDDDCSDGDESMSEVGGDECIQDMNTDDEDIDAISEKKRNIQIGNRNHHRVGDSFG